MPQLHNTTVTSPAFISTISDNNALLLLNYFYSLTSKNSLPTQQIPSDAETNMTTQAQYEKEFVINRVVENITERVAKSFGIYLNEKQKISLKQIIETQPNTKKSAGVVAKNLHDLILHFLSNKLLRISEEKSNKLFNYIRRQQTAMIKGTNSVKNSLSSTTTASSSLLSKAEINSQTKIFYKKLMKHLKKLRLNLTQEQKDELKEQIKEVIASNDKAAAAMNLKKEIRLLVINKLENINSDQKKSLRRNISHYIDKAINEMNNETSPDLTTTTPKTTIINSITNATSTAWTTAQSWIPSSMSSFFSTTNQIEAKTSSSNEPEPNNNQGEVSTLKDCSEIINNTIIILAEHLDTDLEPYREMLTDWISELLSRSRDKNRENKDKNGINFADQVQFLKDRLISMKRESGSLTPEKEKEINDSIQGILDVVFMELTHDENQICANEIDDNNQIRNEISTNEMNNETSPDLTTTTQKTTVVNSITNAANTLFTTVQSWMPSMSSFFSTTNQIEAETSSSNKSKSNDNQRKVFTLKNCSEIENDFIKKLTDYFKHSFEINLEPFQEVFRVWIDNLLRTRDKDQIKDIKEQLTNDLKTKIDNLRQKQEKEIDDFVQKLFDDTFMSIENQICFDDTHINDNSNQIRPTL